MLNSGSPKYSTVQELFEAQKFLVIAYSDATELEKDLAAGFSQNICEGDVAGLTLPIVGTATFEEWEKQCIDYEAMGSINRYSWIGFVKVVAE